MKNQASIGRPIGSRGRERRESENPHYNRNFQQNSGRNRQRGKAGGPQSGVPSAAAHAQNLGRAGSFPDAAAPHSAAPRRSGSDGGRGSGGGGRGGRGGAHYVACQPSWEHAALAATGASARESQPTVNSFSMSTVSTTSVTQMPGAPNGYSWSHQGSALISWSIGSAICRLKYVATFVGIIIFLFSRIV